MRFEILSPGQKVKKLRKFLGASQEDITGNLKTRNTISQIENGKQNLTRETAAIIAQELNNIAVRKNIKIEPVTTTYLLEKKADTINRIALEIIDELETCKFINNLNHIRKVQTDTQNFINRYSNLIDYKNKYKIHFTITNILFGLRLYNESELYILKAYDTASEKNDMERTLEALRKRIQISLEKDESSNTLILAKHAVSLTQTYSITDTRVLAKTFFNVALAYKKSEEYMKCIDYIKELLSLNDLQVLVLINAKILEANCYVELKRYDLAEKIYLETVKDAKENNCTIEVARIYRNLSNLCRFTKEYEKAKNYTEIFLNINNLDAYESAISLYYAVHIFIECDELSMVRRYLFRALKALEVTNDSKKQIILITNLIDYLLVKKDIEYIEEIFNYIYDKMNNNILKDKALIEKAFLITVNFETLGLKDKYYYYRDKALYLNNMFFSNFDF